MDATPAPRGKSHAVPFTPAAAPTVLRAPRLGEMFYSQTGLPLWPAEELSAPGCGVMQRGHSRELCCNTGYGVNDR